MSLSNPNANGQPNPSSRWFDWGGKSGCVSFYDKDTKSTVELPMPFVFVLLDEVASIKGWHDASASGIYSNAVRNIVDEPFTVKAFKGGNLVEGFYRDIKDKIKAAGGAFHATCYLAYRMETGAFEIGAIHFKGAALGAWMDFRKAHRNEFYKDKAIRIDGFTEGKKGSVTYRVPKFSMMPTSPNTLEICIDLDKKLQAYLDTYFAAKNEAPTVSTEKRAHRSVPDENGRYDFGDDLPNVDTIPVPVEAYDNVETKYNDEDIPF